MSDPTRGRFQRLEELFERAVALPDGERAHLLSELERGDPELAVELRRLLVADSESGRLSAVADGISQALRHWAGDQPLLGNYRLERVLGEGGMGVVYEAVQEEPIRRRVAIKLIRGEIHGPRLAARFQAEAQALALMNHPNVARVLEVGASPEGKPYFVMELIAGTPLVRYCRERRLGLSARLGLFLEVCEGVQHAHQKGILHRDLKPANILVAEEGGRAVPKIIDFGVARSLEPLDEGDAGLTRQGEAVGTLEYMSPEQAAGDVRLVDTRTDVYSLGVILYELLTGRLPVPRARLQGVPITEAQRRVREDEPSPPSRFAPADGTPAEPGDESTSAFGRRLRGDLDWIVLTALAKEPDRRYATVSELADDLRRHLASEPVRVGPPSATYRAAKLLRRHRWAVAAAAVLLLASLVAAAGTTAGMLRARRAEAAARADAATAERVSELLVDLFRATDPRAGQGGDTPVREFLAGAAGKLESDLAEEPEVRARLLLALGEVHANLGLFEPAIEHVDESLRLRSELFGDASVEVAEALVERGSILRQLDRLPEAEADFRRGLAIQEERLGSNAVELGDALNGLGVVLRASAPAEAYAAYRRSLALAEAAHGPDHANVVRSRANLATLDARAERWAEAADGLERALASARRVFGEDHPDVASIMGNLAFVQRKLGRLRRSRQLFEEALAIEVAKLGPDHPSLATSRINLVAVCQRLGDLPAAEDHGRRAVESLAATLSPGHSLLGIARNNHAVTLLRMGRLGEARELVEETRAAVADAGEAEARQLWLRNTVLLSTIERRAGNAERALALAEAAVAAAPPEGAADALWARAHALAALGSEEARAAAAEATALEGGGDAAPASLEGVRFLALVGDAEAALAELGRAAADAPPDAFWLSDPELAPLRALPSYPAFAETLAASLGAA